MTILNNGSAGIGVACPTHVLDIYGTSTETITITIIYNP